MRASGATTKKIPHVCWDGVEAWVVVQGKGEGGGQTDGDGGKFQYNLGEGLLFPTMTPPSHHTHTHFQVLPATWVERGKLSRARPLVSKSGVVSQS